MMRWRKVLFALCRERRIPGGVFRVTRKPRCGAWRSDPALALGPRGGVQIRAGKIGEIIFRDQRFERKLIPAVESF